MGTEDPSNSQEEIDYDEWQQQPRVSRSCRYPSQTHEEVKCQNRFRPLEQYREDVEELADDHQIVRQIVKTKNIKNKDNNKPLKQFNNNKNKILILADSNGRKCSSLIQERFGSNYAVTSIIKPNASFEDVIKDVESIEKRENFTDKDYIVIMGGTNNLNKNITSPPNFNMEPIKSVAKNTNIVLMGVPKRFDMKDSAINDRIKLLNDFLNKQRTDMRECDLKIIPLGKVMFNRSDHTSHGLHFNYKGKLKLCTQMVQSIKKHLRMKKADMVKSLKADELMDQEVRKDEARQLDMVAFPPLPPARGKAQGSPPSPAVRGGPTTPVNQPNIHDQDMQPSTVDSSNDNINDSRQNELSQQHFLGLMK